MLYVIAGCAAGFSLADGFASNGYGEHSPGGYSLLAGLVTEIVMTMAFLPIILGATDSRAPQGFAPIAIGFGLTLIRLISIPVPNTSVNPARSTGVAIYAGGWALTQPGSSGLRQSSAVCWVRLSSALSAAKRKKMEPHAKP